MSPPPYVQSDIGFAPAPLVRKGLADYVMMPRQYSSANGRDATCHDIGVTASAKPPNFFIEGLFPVQGRVPSIREGTPRRENAPSTVARPHESGAGAGLVIAAASTVGLAASASLVAAQRKDENDLGGVALNVVEPLETTLDTNRTGVSGDFSEVSSDFSDSVDLDNERDQVDDDEGSIRPSSDEHLSGNSDS